MGDLVKRLSASRYFSAVFSITSVGNCGTDQNQLPFSLPRRQYQERTNRRVSQGAQGTFETAAFDNSRWAQSTQIETGSRIPRQHRWSYSNRIPATIRARFESCRVSLGLAQAPCAGELLPEQSWRVADDRSKQTQKRTAPPVHHHGMLEASGPVVMS